MTIAILIPLTLYAGGELYGHDPGSVYLWAFTGLIGMVAGLAYWHGYRGLGFVPFALTGAAAATLLAEALGWHRELIAVSSGLAGFAYTRMARAIDVTAPGQRPLGWVLIGFGVFVTVATEFVTFAPADENPSAARFAALLGFMALIAWLFFFRPAIELAVEPLLWLMYSVRAAGPGLAQVPARGPCLVVANHACWLDPLFLGKLLPRPITPMMAARFYDRPVLRWLMRRVYRTIRVPERALKQDVPDEIREAVAALDRGECVVIFPEGSMRRAEDRPLKRFGRGVWQILSARPDTPVVACWIEGGWGSYFSYWNGKPTRNKRPDFRRRIGVAVTEPVTADAETLAHHLRTRLLLMNRVAAARPLLGPPALPPFELPAKDCD